LRTKPFFWGHLPTLVGAGIGFFDWKDKINTVDVHAANDKDDGTIF